MSETTPNKNCPGDAFRAIGATTYLCPTPAVLVGCAADAGWKRGESQPNLITLAWAGVCCTHPPLLGLAIRPERLSHGLILRSGECTVNLVGEALLAATDFCGVRSGRDVDKFAALGLTAVDAPPLSAAPALGEAPACLCCRVRQVIPLGSHDLFLVEVVDVRVAERYFRVDGSIDEQAMELIGYVHGKYRALGAELGFFGFSVAGDEARARRGFPPAAVGGAVIKKPAAGKATVKTHAVGQSKNGPVTGKRATPGRASAGKASSGRASAGETTVGKPSTGKATTPMSPSGTSPHRRAMHGKALIEAVTVKKSSANGTSSGESGALRADKVKTNPTTVDPANARAPGRLTRGKRRGGPR